MERGVGLDRFQDLLADGYGPWEDNDAIGACGPWLEAWTLFLGLIDETGSKSIRRFDEKFRPEWLVFNWVQDLEEALWNAGTKDSDFLRKGITYATEYLKRFAPEDDLTTENMRRSLASFHCRLGETDKVEALYEEWLSRDPQWGWGWIGWSDCYQFDCGKPDPSRAESLLQRGLSIPDLRDEFDVLERLRDLHLGQGRDAEARAIQERLDQEVVPDVNPYSLPDDERDADSVFDSGIDPIRRGPKIGRNHACPCGSGKKYKKCCGR